MVKHSYFKVTRSVAYPLMLAAFLLAWAGCSSSPKEGEGLESSNVIVDPVGDGNTPQAGTDPLPTSVDSTSAPSLEPQPADPQAGAAPATDPNAFGSTSTPMDSAVGMAVAPSDPNAVSASIDMPPPENPSEASTKEEAPKKAKRRSLSGLAKSKKKNPQQEEAQPQEDLYAQQQLGAPTQDMPNVAAQQPAQMEQQVAPPPAPPVQALAPPPAPAPAPAYTPPPAPVYNPPAQITPPMPQQAKQMAGQAASEGGLLKNRNLLGAIILGVVALLGISFFTRSRKSY